MARLKYLLYAISVVAVALMLWKIFCGEPRVIKDQYGGDPWRNVIYDFQTLITGILALIAAGWTVRMMHLTDKASALRHEELVSLQMRADKLLIERNAHQLDIMLSGQFAKLAGFDVSSLDNPLTEEGVRVADYVDIVAHTISSIVGSEKVDGIKHLFGGRLANDIHELRGSLNLLRTFYRRLKIKNGETEFGISDRPMSDHERRSIATAVPQTIVSIGAKCEAVARGIKELRSIYKID